VILTAATIWLKPLIHRWFRSMAARSASRRSKITEKLVQYLLVLAVAAIIWILVVNITAVYVYGFFSLWGWVAPPVALTIAWAVYDLVDDRVEARAGALYDRATTRSARTGDAEPGAASIPPAPAGYPGASTGGGAAASRPRPDDGLTDEQRRMFDQL
jgi:hypothetical protein